MGRTPIPLTIWADVAFVHHPEMEKLREMGHEIVGLDFVALNLGRVPTPDIILSRAAFAWGPDMWSYLPQVLKEARKRRKEPVDESPADTDR